MSTSSVAEPAGPMLTALLRFLLPLLLLTRQRLGARVRHGLTAALVALQLFADLFYVLLM